MIRRSMLTLVLVSTFVVGMGVLPALAKMPPFEVDVVAEDGEVLTSVRVDGFQGSTVPLDGFDPADLGGLLAVYPSGDLDDRGRPINHDNAVPVDLEWSGKPRIYEGSVVLNVSGGWAVVPFPTIVEFDPDSSIHEAYPATVYFEILADRAAMFAMAVGLGGLLLTVGVLVSVRRRRIGSGSGIRAQHWTAASK